MADPLGFISGAGGAGRHFPVTGPGGPGAGIGGGAARPGDSGGPQFKDAMLKALDEVNRLQQEATRAVEDFQTGQRTDLEGVILATQQADNAFRMLQALRNRMMEAFDEARQIRV